MDAGNDFHLKFIFFLFRTWQKYLLTGASLKLILKYNSVRFITTLKIALGLPAFQIFEGCARSNSKKTDSLNVSTSWPYSCNCRY
jgi:hypothetical protein